jgi:VCBS repeat-containing protein
MATNTDGGTTASFNNTPQAKDDYLTAGEDCIYSFDVMANDLGGNAKVLWSIDDTTMTDDSGNGSIDLLTKDGTPTSIPECSDLGARISIENGIVKYDSNTIDFLAAGQQAVDKFTYAIRMANGTLSWATVYVTLTGTNDSVAITSASATGTVVEDSATTPSASDSNVASGTIAFSDVDLADTHTAISAAALTNTTALGTFALGSVNEASNAANGSVGWTYTINEAAAQYLAAGQSVTESYVVTIDDGNGSTTTQTVTITITGTNDVVTVTSATATGAVVEDSAATPSLTDSNAASGTINFSDIDLADTHMATSAAAPTNTTALGTFVLGSVSEAASAANGSVGWTYTINEAAAQYLGEGESVTEKYIVTIDDGHGSTTTQTITITVTGTNDDPVLSVDAAGAVTEDAADPTLSDTGTLSFTDVDVNDTHTVGASYNNDAVWTGGSLDAGQVTALTAGFTADADSWDYALANAAVDFLAAGETITLSFDVTVTDNHGGSDTETVTVTITGSNDAPIVASEIADQASDEDALWTFPVPAGTFTDVDHGALLTYSATLGNGDPLPSWLTFDADTQTFSGTPPTNFNGMLDLKVTASDGTESVSDTFQLTIVPVNDAPVNTMAASYATNEDTPLSLSGLSVSDVDAGTGTISVTLTVSGGTLAAANAGSVTVSGSGTNSIVLSGTLADINAYLAAAATQPSFAPDANATVNVTLTMTTDDGGNSGSGGALSDSDIRTISITPVNDPAVISGATSGSVTEDAAQNTAAGDLNSTDIDGTADSWNAVSVAAASANGYGAYTIDASGHWVYALDNGNPAVNALNNGGPLSDSFTVTTADGTSQLVSITINGHTDAVVITLPPTDNGADPNDFDTLTGGAPNNLANINGTSGNDTITGGSGGQTISGNQGNDTIYGGGGNDNINGNNDNDTLYGQGGTDTVDGNNGLDTLYGGSGNDTLTGGNDADAIYGGSGNDIVNGSGGNDSIIGGYGADTLTGSTGNDTFVYLDVKDTNDTITDFASGDKIDLSAIDANSILAGDQGFAFGGTTATANGVWYAQSGGNVIVYVDTDGTAATAELSITLNNVSTLQSTDFLLGP